MLLAGSLGDITKTDVLNFCDCEDDCCEIEVNFMRSTEFVVDPANAQNVRQAEYKSIAAMNIPANNRLRNTP